MLDKSLFLGLKFAIFGDSFVQKYVSIENENSELKFTKKIIELQLNTLKRKNEELLKEKKKYVSSLMMELCELITEHEKVSSRIRRIFDLLKEM